MSRRAAEYGVLRWLPLVATPFPRGEALWSGIDPEGWLQRLLVPRRAQGLVEPLVPATIRWCRGRGRYRYWEGLEERGSHRAVDPVQWGYRCWLAEVAASGLRPGDPHPRLYAELRRWAEVDPRRDPEAWGAAGRILAELGVWAAPEACVGCGAAPPAVATRGFRCLACAPSPPTSALVVPVAGWCVPLAWWLREVARVVDEAFGVALRTTRVVEELGRRGLLGART